ncbi:hypothetical protein [Novosphingobium sp. M1R2S20]|uniref:Methylamine utilization protein MauD n=1 Tax=Novosphingobium rhizovicinum TaxID=3228928 RepID=A0ABV3REH0_9SPHN
MLIALLFLMGVGTALLIVAVLATRRQMYLDRRALAPVDRFAQASGDEGAEPAPILSVPALDGAVLTIGGATRDRRFQLLLFIEAKSALCDFVVGQAVELCHACDVRLLLFGEGQVQDYAELLARHAINAHDFVLNGSVGEDYLIGPLPSAALLDGLGNIIARGTVQRREQLEMLLVPADRRAETIKGRPH